MLNLNVQIHQYLFWNQLICTVTADCASQLDWPWKTTPKWPFECQNPSTGSKDTVIIILMSADLYSHSWCDLMTGLAMKNYPKMTLWMSKSIHWIKSYWRAMYTFAFISHLLGLLVLFHPCHSGIWGFMTLIQAENRNVSKLKIHNWTENKT